MVMRTKSAAVSGRTQVRPSPARARGAAAFTLIEVVIATAIVALLFGGIINCYIQSGVRVEWTGYSLAAQSMAMQVIDQAKSASWSPTSTPPVNNLTNLNLQGTSYNSATATFTGYSVGVLDLPYATSNYTMATNFVTVQMITNVGNQAGVQMQFVRVDTVWPFFLRKQNLFFTNTVGTLLGPDDRSF
jgi:type II secretory pathway pseudopilin PulG